MRLNKNSITGISLDAAGLVALADLSAIKIRTALTGSASMFDIFFLVPGIHTQQEASNVNGGELPATAAMTTGYIFRVENQATVSYLQTLGEPGHLVTLTVSRERARTPFFRLFKNLSIGGPIVSVLYLTGILLTITFIVLLGTIHDYWAIGILLMLVFARFLNTIVIKRRTELGWKGVSEPGVKGDLLVLLSQDRWVRIKGLVDDLKVVTSGQWLREQTNMEEFASSFATLLVYIAAALAANASTIGSLLIAILLLVSVALLGLCNTLTHDLHMFGCCISILEGPKKYTRRLDMAQELIEETGSDGWAIALGLIRPPEGTSPTKVIL